MRLFPAVSVIGVAQTPFAVQVTDAPETAPLASTSAIAVVRTAPTALFQFAWSTTPAVSLAAIGDGLLPVKSMPIAPFGTICSPFTGARRVPVEGSVGAAVRENSVPVMLKRT